MDYKQVLKVATAKQDAFKEKLSSCSLIMKDLGPPKKEEKQTKGIKSAGVKAFLENQNKSRDPNKNCSQGGTSFHNNSNKKFNSEGPPCEDFDVKNLFKKDRRVARMPDEAIPNMMEISKLRKQHMQEKEDAKQAEIRAREERERAERQKQKEKEKAEAAKRDTLKRVMTILNKDSPPKVDKVPVGVKRPHSAQNDGPGAKKIKPNEGSVSSGSSKAVRKVGVPKKRTGSVLPPPLKFEDILKVAEKNNNEQIPDETVREILSVDLSGSCKSSKKDPDEKVNQKRDGMSNCRSSQIKTKTPAPTNVSSNKTLRPNNNNALSTKQSNAPTSKNSVPSCHNGAFKKPTVGNVSNGGRSNASGPKNGGVPNGNRAMLPKVVKNGESTMNSKTITRNPIKGTKAAPSVSAQSKIKESNSTNNIKRLEAMTQNLDGIPESMRDDILKILKQGITHTPSLSIKGGQNSFKKPGLPVGRQTPATQNRPSGTFASRPPDKKPEVNGWERAMSQLNSRGSVKQKQAPPRRDYEVDDDDDGYEDEEDDGMDDFIDDSEDTGDYSSAIRNIFKYDKRKYINEDDDVSDMESNFQDIEKEERISSRLGLQEDLEDMRLEQEELKRKKLMRAKSGKGR